MTDGTPSQALRERIAEYERLKERFLETAGNAHRAQRDREETGQQWAERAEMLSSFVRRDEGALDRFVLAALGEPDPGLLALANNSPILSKYHGAGGFDLERFIKDYEIWREDLRAYLSQKEGW